jgi:hypothetical protein
MKHYYESLRIKRLPEGGFVVCGGHPAVGEEWLAAFSHDELHLALRFIGERIEPKEEELD